VPFSDDLQQALLKNNKKISPEEITSNPDLFMTQK
jgi:hypothetical protein